MRRPLLLLALPFAVGVAATEGLTTELHTFHWTDGHVYHLPTIRAFADQLPTPDLVHYPAAQTPLFHLVLAVWGKLVGLELWRLQALEVVISYLAAVALFRLLRRRLDEVPALALAFAFAVSPYVFGISFLLLTDNLALLFTFLALERFAVARESGALAPFALGCLAMAGAVLTRQAFVWLFLVALWSLTAPGLESPRRAGGLALAAGALAPLAALVIAWGGLVPPDSDPSSCGLCASSARDQASALSPRSALFTLALLAVYAAVVIAPGAALRWRAWRAAVAPAAGGAVAGALLLAAFPLRFTAPGGGAGDAGWLWQVAGHAPTLLGSSLLFWALVPAGAAAAAVLVGRAGATSLGAVYLGAFLLAACTVRLGYQKYFDPFALVAVGLLARPGDLRGRWAYTGLVLFVAASAAYAINQGA